MKAISIMLMVLGCILILPALTLFVDIWTWVMLGSGITPVDWSYTSSNGFTDKVAKPILALMSGVLGVPTLLVSVHAYPTERYNCI